MFHQKLGENTDRQSIRREFFRQTFVCSLICSLAASWLELLGVEREKKTRYDLLVKDGKVVDPSQKFSGKRDIAITGRRITRVAEDIPEVQARQVLDARGMTATPGLTDVHVCVCSGVAPFGIPADPNCIAKGVTTVLDVGSSSAHTFPGLQVRHQYRRYASLCAVEHIACRPINDVPEYTVRRVVESELCQSSGRHSHH